MEQHTVYLTYKKGYSSLRKRRKLEYGWRLGEP